MKSAVILTMDPEQGLLNVDKVGDIDTPTARQLCRMGAEYFTEELIKERVASERTAHGVPWEEETDAGVHGPDLDTGSEDLDPDGDLLPGRKDERPDGEHESVSPAEVDNS